jgi:hypothetical protein
MSRGVLGARRKDNGGYWIFKGVVLIDLLEPRLNISGALSPAPFSWGEGWVAECPYATGSKASLPR